MEILKSLSMLGEIIRKYKKEGKYIKATDSFFQEKVCAKLLLLLLWALILIQQMFLLILF